MPAIRNSSRLIRRLIDDQSGAAMTEYAVVVGLVIIAIVAILMQVGPKVLARWATVGTKLDGTGSPIVITAAQKSQTH